MNKILAVLMLFASGTVMANEAQKLMMQLPSEKQDIALRHVIESTGYSCSSITKKLFQGQDKRGNAIWSAACTDGKSYSLVFYNDAQGSTKVLDCATLKTVAGTKCFTKF